MGMHVSRVSTFPRRMLALRPSVRRSIQERFDAIERQIRASRDEPLVAEMFYKQWLEGMEVALREAEAVEI